MSRSSPWPTSWRGSPGRCCSAGNRLTPTRYPWPRRDSFGRSESAGRASGVCERVTTRWPDSQTALRKPGVENGARRRRVYEDRGARISILAGRRPPRPDTLKQTDQPPISTNPLQTGRAIRFQQNRRKPDIANREADGRALALLARHRDADGVLRRDEMVRVLGGLG